MKAFVKNTLAAFGAFYLILLGLHTMHFDTWYLHSEHNETGEVHYMEIETGARILDWLFLDEPYLDCIGVVAHMYQTDSSRQYWCANEVEGGAS